MKNYQYIFTHAPSTNLTLEYNPLNWADINVEFVRSERYHSILRNSIIEVELPFDGKAYIDTIYSAYGIDTDIGLTINLLDKSDFSYSELYVGIVDLSEWTSRRDTTSVKIIDSSVMAKFVSRDEIDVPINRLDDLDGDTLPVYSYLNGVQVTGVDIEEHINLIFDTPQVNPTTSTTNTIEEAPTIEEIEWNESNRDYANSSGAAEELEYTVGVKINWDVVFPGTPTNLDIIARISRNGSQEDILTVNLRESGAQAGDDEIVFDNTYSIPDGAYLGRMTLEIIAEAGITGDVWLSDGSLDIGKLTDAHPDTFISSPLLHELGAKLLEIITGVSDPLNAPLLGRTDSTPRTYGSDGDYSLLSVDSGYMLRGFTFTTNPLTTNFADYFKSIDALFNLGFWYDGTDFVIAAKEDFYKTSEIISLGEVEGLETTIAGDEYFNSIKCGYRDKLSYEEVNGNQNFNVPMEFANGGKRIPNTLDIQSVYHGDDYGIELSRQAKKSISFSEDTNYDDQIFFIWLKRDSGLVSVPGSDFAAVTGVYTPDTRLNLHITPKRNLLRHLNHLPVPLFISGGDTMYMNKQYELGLTTQISGDPVITEKDDLTTYDEPLFYPEIYNFTAPLTDAHTQQLRTDPHGYVSFDNLGVTLSGFILEVSTEPFMRKGNWTLIKRNPNR